MAIKNAYLKGVYDGLVSRNGEQKEFLQAVEEVLESLEPIIEKRPEFQEAGIIAVSYTHLLQSFVRFFAAFCPHGCRRLNCR